jgi:hypothetical protein
MSIKYIYIFETASLKKILMIMSATLISIICIANSAGCAVSKDQRSKCNKVPPIGEEYPALLPVEKTHKVKVNYYDPLIPLQIKDISDIAILIGRIPGIPRYEIDTIMRSELHPGKYEVCLLHYRVIIEHGEQWRVYRIIRVNY